jgi:hydroxymethylbilane synthase
LASSIRIAVFAHGAQKEKVLRARGVLSEAGIRAEILEVEGPTALLRGDIDVFPADMATLPPLLPEGWKIAAVSERQDPADVLLVRVGSTTAGRLFGLRERARVGCFSPLQKAQFGEFRPDLELTMAGEDDVAGTLALLWEGQLDGLLVPAHVAFSFSQELLPFQATRLHPQEMVPLPAQGVTAWIAFDGDASVQRMLKAIHHPEVSAATNVERMALRLLGQDAFGNFGAYCTRDAGGNYHVSAARSERQSGMLRRAAISSSTNFQLAARLAASIA